MPELPELEIFAANLEKHFKDKVLQRVEVQHAKKLNVYKQDLWQSIQGQRLHNVKRDGKTLLMLFRRGRSLALHLMLTGELKVLNGGEEVLDQIVSFHFDGDLGFALTDRKKQAMVTLNPQASLIPDVLSGF